ncbi:uncharacterized protein H6S33_012285 [Morchella sextelata]|uniref:uncharacterized protein n=1 Tax=Morchella sextelata TaxID=1174677 RepID=UPI001D03C4D5|nr:uncharacterized protein H6S33_012285 [Morchella sextelata]KAH0609739.1 hypothetical protein H6S33_012285 [Morchella sextelata]
MKPVATTSQQPPPPYAMNSLPPNPGSSDLTSRLSLDTSKLRDTPPQPSQQQQQQQQQQPDPTDSLSLQQLRRVVVDAGKFKQPDYTFVYDTSDSLPAELSEWFSYSADTTALVLSSRDTFERTYATLSQPPHQSAPPKTPPKWNTSKDVKRRRFIARCADLLESADAEQRLVGLEGLFYVVQGCFGEIRGGEEEQLWRIKKNVTLVRAAGVVERVFNCVRGSVGREWGFVEKVVATGKLDEAELAAREQAGKELRVALSVLYFLIEVTRRRDTAPGVHPGEDAEQESLRSECTDLPVPGSLLGFLAVTLSRLRWTDDDTTTFPLHALLSLTWKTLLLTFGSSEHHLPAVKRFARVAAGLSPEIDKKEITASPLDYQSFRNDIIAKYPVYDPPRCAFPFDLSSSSASFLPTVAATPPRSEPTGVDALATAGSILEKAVHIATPAPSPPPSPGGGKGGKKQNYQTNNNFPFLYPAGDGDGGTGGCWWKEECELGVPASIKEAGELFAGRVRSTLAMRQLWNEKEAYERYERGWDVDLDEKKGVKVDEEEGGREKRWEEKRLDAVEELFKVALPQLQSLVIVMLKVILASVTAPPLQAPPPSLPPQGQQISFADQENGRDEKMDFGASIKGSWNIFGRNTQEQNKFSSTNPNAKPAGEDGQPDLNANHKLWEEEKEAEEKRRDAQRMREITSKAVSAILLGLLKWFRVSHVLKFEYLTQLLLDSNYLPLVLKLFNQHDTVVMVTTRTDRPEKSYWTLCNLHSTSPTPPPATHPPTLRTPDSSPDSACPPPIPKFPHSPLPPPPTTAPDPTNLFAWRPFFTSITLLRTLQKTVKHKSHRNLSLVQYKSSAILRKPLKCAHPLLRLYTLKLFKGQVPYCGRKWRQSNMRVITNIYLHCRPELRDDWLAGGDVDGEVEESMPVEMAVRALARFYCVRRYPREMGVGAGAGGGEVGGGWGERDFFGREVGVGEWEEEEEGWA